ncbi:Bax inhibitor-1/YccA family protein [Nocardioides sp. ChNu-153]|uniref:Bax inhibitor-1/YccA family protein n=1 Tax=unclassified Nocardioides TaxID=2615069 RepID=UPI0024054380|nr:MULTISPECIES: Bax inhibitor-1/YccA family protein [unclassified Nocardioides]MDF9717463.1 Bax inhibitor-1/YccA family protein [Nocardioides sp. ChNu-99]MDN7120453.1 Bax inhibitor-1/YccA family protein [Nocardioides sp. ChNu-153]
MQSNNPVFRRSAEFNGSRANGTPTYAGGVGYGQPQGQPYGYGDPASWDMSRATAPAPASGRMTIDTVVQKTAFSVGTVILAAMATWILTPDITTTNTDAMGALGALAGLGALAAFGLSMVNSFKRLVSPALVMAFAVAEGVALGALSKMFNGMFGGGVVMGAVIGTFAAFAGTLAAYKVLNIRVGDKFRIFVVAAMFGMVGLGLMELVLGLFGAQIGLFGFGGLGTVMAIVGLVLGVFMLILDFDFVEQGIAAGLDERESWRAAFAMTVSLVWIYTNLLRLLAIFSQD